MNDELNDSCSYDNRDVVSKNLVIHFCRSDVLLTGNPRMQLSKVHARGVKRAIV